MGQPSDREKIEAEAAEWVIRLGGESAGDRERKDFDAWRSQSPHHAQAFEFAQRTWGELAELRNDPGSLAGVIVRAPAQRRSASAGVATRGQGGRRWLGAIVPAICLVVLAGFVGFWYGNPVTMLAADYRTAPGEQETLTLPDGSTVDLASGSAIALHFNDTERRVELLEGAAYFMPAPVGGDEKRPFVVEGANGTATALGTQFLVARLPDAVEVAVSEHQVRVALSESSQAASVVLSPGQSVRYSPEAGMSAIVEKNVDLASAWRRGRLVFDQAPLKDVIAELNRYRRGRIVISDSGMANRKVSGVFETKDLDNALRTIARELHLRTASVPPLMTVLY